MALFAGALLRTIETTAVMTGARVPAARGPWVLRAAWRAVGDAERGAGVIPAHSGSGGGADPGHRSLCSCGRSCHDVMGRGTR